MQSPTPFNSNSHTSHFCMKLEQNYRDHFFVCHALLLLVPHAFRGILVSVCPSKSYFLPSVLQATHMYYLDRLTALTFRTFSKKCSTILPCMTK